MNTVLVRYGEIGTKSRHVRNNMLEVLRQRVADRLKYEGIEYEKISAKYGRVIVKTGSVSQTVENIKYLPGVKSVSPCIKTSSDIEYIKQATDSLEITGTFGVATNRAGEHGFDSQDVNIEVGSYIEDSTGCSVDLDNPDTLVEVDVRKENAYIFTERFEGPNGYPVGFQGEYATLISGGIDSPVAAYEIMTRGADIVPIYFYNAPIAAEDHFLRFKSSVDCLKRFHPSKDWYGYRINMEEVNRRLIEVERGRMVIHRRIMFKVAERIAEKEGLDGVVTGESLGQKSSQTSINLSNTSSKISKPILRPLITWNKQDIVDKAKDLGTFEQAEVDSACRSMAPDTPATSIRASELQNLEDRIDLESLMEIAFENIEKIDL